MKRKCVVAITTIIMAITACSTNSKPIKTVEPVDTVKASVESTEATEEKSVVHYNVDKKSIKKNFNLSDDELRALEEDDYSTYVPGRDNVGLTGN